MADEITTELPPCAFRVPGLQAIVHIANDYEIEVGGKLVRFEMGNYGGPALIGKRGDPLKNQPGCGHPFWTAFELWWKQGHRLRDGNRCVYEEEPKPRIVKLWRGNYTQVDHDDPRTDEEIRAGLFEASKQSAEGGKEK